MKKWLGLCLVMVMMVLAACGGDTAKESDTKASVAGDDNATKEQSEDVRLIAGTVVLANIMDRLDLDAIAVPDTAKELPARFDGLPNIGNAMQPDMEIIKSLNPSEVLSVSTLEYDLKDSFEQLNVPVDFVDLTSIDSMLGEIEEIGARYNRADEATTLVKELQNQIAAVQTIKKNEGARDLYMTIKYQIAPDNSCDKRCNEH